MSNITVKCPVEVFRSGAKLTPVELVDQARNLDQIELTFELGNGNEVPLLLNNEKYNLRSTIDEKASTSTIVPNCHYSGNFDGLRQSLSICDYENIAGLIMVSGNTFSISAKDGQFILTPQIRNSCEVFQKPRLRRAINSKANDLAYVKDLMDGKWRFVELALVADNSMYRKFKSDEAALNNHLHSIVNIMNSLYYPLHIRISLVYSEIWKEGDKLSVVSDANKSLSEFMNYRKGILKEHPHDNAHLLTNVVFTDGVVGKAYRGTMCSYDYSGGVFMDHNEDVAIVAGTVTHEMGHNFGMDHDVDPQTCNCPTSQCIMAPQSGRLEYWSECSVKFLSSAINRGVDICLLNEPGIKAGDAKCGNGIIESGEECDCGQESCPNNCCNGKTCQLNGEAKCASGDCCDLEICQPKPRATVCRAATGICDLDEYCNGKTQDCPPDFFVQNGNSCPGRDNEFCYEGTCGSREDQCSLLWGPTGVAGDERCYSLNTKGTWSGHCGHDVHTDQYTPCKNENKQCGLLQCETTAERPVYGTSNAIVGFHTPIYLDANYQTKKYCYGVKSTYVGTAKQKQPGMVPDGAPCGKGMICVENKCRDHGNVTKLTASCEANCHDRGICNNVGNCHCERGFGGIACEIPGYGGSVNSNDAYSFRGITLSSTFLVFFILFGFFIAGLCIYYRVKRNRNLLTESWVYVKKNFDLHGTLIPTRHAPPPPKQRIDRAGLASTWGEPQNGYIAVKPPSFLPPAIPLVSYSSVAAPESNAPKTANTAHIRSFDSRDDFNKTLRPKDLPPSVPNVPLRPPEEVIEKLHEECAEEIGIGKVKPKIYDKPLPSVPKVQDEKTPLRRNESMSRPGGAPPPPPAQQSQSKPAVPAKPPRAIQSLATDGDSSSAKVDVKSMAAKFDSQKK
ncbi:unnamed protein product [Caenorhabditis auriculariae]|uniref:Uncharacterized protein n=1 Tax=Caenorhabditis auriculariae TaxID=2777116 RepID=A0A8S1GRZ7_9PELO|nr:unnamed protein product [Caenorhabditis auriculariae]